MKLASREETMVLNTVLDFDQIVQLHVNGDLKGAEEGYRSLIAGNAAHDTVFNNLGLVCFHSGRKEEALSLLNQALEINPANQEALLNLGVVLRSLGRIEEAIATYRCALAVNPQNPELLNNLGLALFDIGATDEALSLFLKALELRDNFPECHFNLGNAHKSRNEDDEAIAAYRRALEYRPAYVQALQNLGYALSSRDLDGAASAYKSAIALQEDYAPAHNNLGNVYKVQKHLEQAMDCFKRAAELDPNYAEAHFNMAQINRDRGDLTGAVAPLCKAVELAPRFHQSLYELGITLQMQGDLESCIECYQIVLQANPKDSQTLNDMGVALNSLARKDEAKASFERAIEINPDSFQAYLNLGGLIGSTSVEDAIKLYHRALEIYPDYPEALNNLGVALKNIDKYQESIDTLKRCIEVRPNYAEARYNLGVTYQSMGKMEEAVDWYKQSLDLKPNYAQAWINLGVCASATMYTSNQNEKLEYAIHCYRKALEANPGYSEAYNNLGVALQDAEKVAESIPNYRKALELNSDYPDAHNNLGNALREQDELDEALESYKRALDVKSANIGDNSFLRELGRHLIELERIPILYHKPEEIDECRARYERTLDTALDMVSQRDLLEYETAALRRIIFRLTNFYLAYHQKNDRDLQVKFSKLMTRVLWPDIGQYVTSERKRRNFDPRIRVGVASEFLRYHNGSFWAYDWVRHLPRDDYQLFSYSLNGITDNITKAWSEISHYRWLPFRDTDYLQSMKVIYEDCLDILIIPDVGMTGSSRVLTLTRMAPIQCVSWGHPVTTGSDTMDIYFGSELMEPEDGDHHYHEKLVRLPNLGLYFEPPIKAPKASRAEFEIPAKKVVFGSVQSLFKYLPQYDYIFPEIARRVPEALFVFGGNKSEVVSDKFGLRLKKAFEDAGLPYEKHVKIIPRMDLVTFVRLLGIIDVNLDSIGWSGGITSLRSIAVDLPIVCFPGDYMRGRHTYAMFKMMGLDELITSSLDEYIDLAVKLGNNKSYRKKMSQKVADNKHKVFHDLECVKELDRVFKAEVNKLGSQ